MISINQFTNQKILFLVTLVSCLSLSVSNAVAKDTDKNKTTDYTEENIKDTEKYVLYESVYFGLSPIEIIGLHCSLINEPSNFLKNKYPTIINDPGFTNRPVNNTICTMAKNGLLQFKSTDKFKAELKELELKHNP